MVKLNEINGTTLRGKIISIGEESCVVQRDAHPPVVILYSDLADVRGAGLSRDAKIGIGVGIGVVVTVAVVAVIAEHNLNGLGNLKVPLY